MHYPMHRWLYAFAVGAVALVSTTAPAFAAAPVSDDFNGALNPVWKQADVGQSDGGSATTAGGEVAATGSGSDIWTTVFQFFYLYQENVTGDFVITSKVTKTPNPDHADGWSSTGIMITAPSALTYDPTVDTTGTTIPPWIFLGLSNNNGVQLKWGAVGQSDNRTVWATVKPPTWIRLVRKGSTFSGFASMDNKTWVLVGSTDIPQAATKWGAADPLLAGIGIQNHDAANLGEGHADDFTVTASPTGDTTPPAKVTDVAATATGSQSVSVTFTAPADGGYELRRSTLPITAANFNAATLVGGLAAIDANGKVTLTDTGLDSLNRYFYAVRSTDESGNVSDLSNVAQAATTAIIGGVNRDVWSNITTGNVNDFIARDDVISGTLKPDISDIQPLAETPSSFADNYAQRIRGFFTPIASGDYTFFIATDDSGTLHLSTDNTPANAAEVAFVTGYAGVREWQNATEATNQMSAPITLMAGKKYYFEAWNKEGGGGDNLAVGFSTTTNADTGLPDVPAGPIPNELLSPFVEVSLGRVAGIVTDANGNPIVGAAVTVKIGDQTYNLTTDANGVYNSLVVAGSATITATLTPWTDATKSATTTVTANQYSAADIQIDAVAPPFKPAAPVAANSDDFSAATLKPIWTSEDVDAAGEGSASIVNGMLNIVGIGADMWDGGDHFHYVYQKVSGDFEAVLHVINTPTTDVWSKVGIDVREVPSADAGLTVDPLGLHFMAAATNGNGEAMQGRSVVSDVDLTDTGISVNAGTFTNGTGYWVKVVRKGQLLQSFKSLDGVSYSFIGQQDFSQVKLSDGTAAPQGFASPEVQIGIASTTHDAAPLETENPTATVDDFIFSNVVSLPTTGGGPVTGCKGDANGDSKVDVNDAVAVLRHSTGIALLTGQARINADVNGDGSTDAGVNVEDAVKVLQYIVGIPNTGITGCAD